MYEGLSKEELADEIKVSEEDEEMAGKIEFLFTRSNIQEFNSNRK